MAYFSNSSDGEFLDIQCADCIHEDPDAGCPIALVQMMFNYDQIGNNKLRDALNMLVSKDGICKMKPFIDDLKRFKPKDIQTEMF